MSEEYNWRSYRKHLDKLLEETTPCIPFLGVLLTTTVQSGSSSDRRLRKASGVEDYTLLEAITVRNRWAHITAVHVHYISLCWGQER